MARRPATHPQDLLGRIINITRTRLRAADIGQARRIVAIAGTARAIHAARAPYPASMRRPSLLAGRVQSPDDLDMMVLNGTGRFNNPFVDCRGYGSRTSAPVLRRLASSLCASAARASGKVVGRPGRSTPVRTARNTLSVIDRTFSGVSVKCVKLGREIIADLAAKLATSTGAVSPDAWPKLTRCP
jgi:hypothetical protein